MQVIIKTGNCFNKPRGKKLELVRQFKATAKTYDTVRAGAVKDIPGRFLDSLGAAVTDLNFGNANYEGHAYIDPSKLDDESVNKLKEIIKWQTADHRYERGSAPSIMYWLATNTLEKFLERKAEAEAAMPEGKCLTFYEGGFRYESI